MAQQQQQQQHHQLQRLRPVVERRRPPPPDLKPSAADSAAAGCSSSATAAASAAAAEQQLLVQEEEVRTCRLCWGEEDDDADAGAWPGGELVSPCSCSGSLAYIHRRCLASWQRTLRAQGQGRKASACELCRAPYRFTPSSRGGGGGGAGGTRRGGGGNGGNGGGRGGRAAAVRALPGRALRAASAAVADALAAGSWPGLGLRAWRCYVLCSGAAHAARLGCSGFAAGLAVGRALVEEQAALLNGALSYSSSLLGSPYAEMLWCQAVGALFVGMLSELAYASILGLLGGAAYGFCMGYAGAVKASARLVAGGGARLLLGAAGAAAGAGRRALRVALLRF